MLTSRTTSLNLYYVAISRARQESRIYTNSVAALPTAIARRFDKTTTLAIQKERVLQRQVQGLQRVGVAAPKPALQRKPLEQKQQEGVADGKKKKDWGGIGMG